MTIYDRRLSVGYIYPHRIVAKSHYTSVVPTAIWRTLLCRTGHINLNFNREILRNIYSIRRYIYIVYVQR